MGAQEKLNELRTLKKSYSDLADKVLPVSDLLTELNNGKQEIVDALATKNVQSSTDKTLLALASDVRSIVQSSITIDGGEMYEKQLFSEATDKTNSYEQPNSPMWNLYQVMANLLGDVRFSSYAAIIVEEYHNYSEYIALQGAGAGGVYLTSDGGLYEYDTIHYWKDDSSKLNRWVAICLYTNDLAVNLSEESIGVYIGKGNITKVKINSKYLNNIAVLFDAHVNEIEFNTTFIGNRFVLKNTDTMSGLIFPISTNNLDVRLLEQIELDAKYIKGDSTYNKILTGKFPNLKNIKLNNLEELDTGSRVGFSHCCATIKEFYLPKIKILKDEGLFYASRLEPEIVNLPLCEYISRWLFWGNQSVTKKIITPSWLNTKNYIFYQGTFDNVEDIWVGETQENIELSAWNPTLVIQDAERLAMLNKNIREHIAARVSNRTGLSSLTFKISSNLYSNLEQETIDAFTAKNWIVAGV